MVGPPHHLVVARGLIAGAAQLGGGRDRHLGRELAGQAWPAPCRNRLRPCRNRSSSSAHCPLYHVSRQSPGITDSSSASRFRASSGAPISSDARTSRSGTSTEDLLRLLRPASARSSACSSWAGGVPLVVASMRGAGIGGVDHGHGQRRDHLGGVHRRVRARAVDVTLRAEVARHPRLRLSSVGGGDLVQHPGQLIGHLLHRREASVGIGVGGAQDRAVQRFVLGEHRHRVGAGQLRRRSGPSPAARPSPARRASARRCTRRWRRWDRSRRSRAPGSRRCRRSRSPRRPCAMHRAEVDELELLVGLHHVVRLEVAVGESLRVQVAKGRRDLDDVGDRLIRRKRSVARLADLLQRRAADVLHDDVADGNPPLNPDARRSCRSGRCSGVRPRRA